MIAISKIAAVMGGERVLGHRVRSLAELADEVAAGLPRRALEACIARVVAAPKERRAAIYRYVPKATFARRGKRLNLVASERTARLARVIATAEFVWGSKPDAHEWLRKPHPELRGKSPLEAAVSELGAQEVEQVLWQLAHGIPA